MDRNLQQPWIQVIGRVAVHRPGRESREPQGASRVLLSILIAAGPRGAKLEEIARAYWNKERPVSWRLALRVSSSHLSTQLPDGWDVTVRNGRFCIVPGDGFIDIWRVADLAEGSIDDVGSLNWLSAGKPFPDVTGVDLVDAASRRMTPMIERLRSSMGEPASGNLAETRAADRRHVEHGQQIRNLRRAIVLAAPDALSLLGTLQTPDEVTDVYHVVGDRRLLLPLGPFAMAFPELRNDIPLDQGVVEPESAAQAFRVISSTLASGALHRPQRLTITNAHELDTTSVQLTSLLIERGRISEFSLVVFADHRHRDLRWLDFVNRSVTAGCELITFAPPLG